MFVTDLPRMIIYQISYMLQRELVLHKENFSYDFSPLCNYDVRRMSYLHEYSVTHRMSYLYDLVIGAIFSSL